MTADELHPAIAALESEDPLEVQMEITAPFVKAAEDAVNKLFELHGTEGMAYTVMSQFYAMLLGVHLIAIEKGAAVDLHAPLIEEAANRTAKIGALVRQGMTIEAAMEHMAHGEEDD